jgi:hypothetical protein
MYNVAVGLVEINRAFFLIKGYPHQLIFTLKNTLTVFIRNSKLKMEGALIAKR